MQPSVSLLFVTKSELYISQVHLSHCKSALKSIVLNINMHKFSFSLCDPSHPRERFPAVVRWGGLIYLWVGNLSVWAQLYHMQWRGSGMEPGSTYLWYAFLMVIIKFWFGLSVHRWEFQIQYVFKLISVMFCQCYFVIQSDLPVSGATSRRYHSDLDLSPWQPDPGDLHLSPWLQSPGWSAVAMCSRRHMDWICPSMQ